MSRFNIQGWIARNSREIPPDTMIEGTVEAVVNATEASRSLTVFVYADIYLGGISGGLQRVEIDSVEKIGDSYYVYYWDVCSNHVKTLFQRFSNFHFADYREYR